MNVIYAILIGAAISLLLNYLADVLPETRKFSRPHCSNCGHSFTAKEYLFSFHCPQCKKKPSLRYWLVLIISISASVLISFYPLAPFNYWESLPLLTFLGLVAVIDIEHRAVLIETDVAGIILCLVYGLILYGPLETLLGGLAGAGIMLILYFGGILFNRILGKIRHQVIDEVALGFGDVLVCGYLGFLMGWPRIIGMVVIAVLMAGVFSLFYLLGKVIMKKYSAFSAIPYVPFLILAALFLFYFPG